jgi:hypothetical protein
VLMCIWYSAKLREKISTACSYWIGHFFYGPQIRCMACINTDGALDGQNRITFYLDKHQMPPILSCACHHGECASGGNHIARLSLEKTLELCSRWLKFSMYRSGYWSQVVIAFRRQ